MRKNEHYIYKWTNLENNKCYIGKTNNKECRYNWFINWDDHYAGPHIDKARKKYNDLKYWKYEILCQCSNEDELNEKEKYYIALYDSNNKYHGYNISSGGTWGDTFHALTEEERKARIEKTVKTCKERQFKWMTDGIISRLINKYHQQEYLNNGWTYGISKITGKKISESLKKSESFKASCYRRRKLTDEERYRRSKEFKNSEEYKEKIELYKENARQRRIAYNKSEAHRKAAIESNKRRWLNGCPEETREKLRKSLKGKAKDKIWVSNGVESKMINKEELNDYINKGYVKGRGSNCQWNTNRRGKKLKHKNV